MGSCPGAWTVGGQPPPPPAPRSALARGGCMKSKRTGFGDTRVTVPYLPSPSYVPRAALRPSRGWRQFTRVARGDLRPPLGHENTAPHHTSPPRAQLRVRTSSALQSGKNLQCPGGRPLLTCSSKSSQLDGPFLRGSPVSNPLPCPSFSSPFLCPQGPNPFTLKLGSPTVPSRWCVCVGVGGTRHQVKLSRCSVSGGGRTMTKEPI